MILTEARKQQDLIPFGHRLSNILLKEQPVTRFLGGGQTVDHLKKCTTIAALIGEEELVL